ncbi:MAG: CRISPR-associated endonuclease Cas2 [Planctomycetes bacterium]|nr:CRISPR-associated endonuclease Cas2 [Planctomycetota bacterium]MCW8135619.1 CRISPR-associated endonuclease Cas2 [Planctomycetota bacterium]
MKEDIERFNDLSGYRAVWLFAMFDLPVATKKDRRNYTRFRKALIREGFMMLQFSVYARYCRSDETAGWFRARVQSQLPPKGQVRLLSVTDRQFGKMEVFFGEKTEPVEEPPHQYELF